jgi:PAS domain S-box-containing protein
VQSGIFGANTQLFLMWLPDGSRRLTSDSVLASQQYTGPYVRKLCLPWALSTFVIAILTISPLQPNAVAQAKETRRILILNEVGTPYPGINLIDQGIRTALENSPYKIEFYREFMETLWFPEPAIERQLRYTYLFKYRNRRPDVIITVGPSPLRFMVETHERFFPGVPIIFCLPNNKIPGSPELDVHFTGVDDSIEAANTLEVALHLQPGTEHVVLVGGTSAFDKQVETIVREQLRSHEDHLDLSYLTNLDMPALLERLKHLPGNTIVVLLSFSQDAAGTRFIDGTESAPMIAAAASVPVFTLFDVNLNHGEVGGDVSSLYDQGKIAGSLALKMLKGEKQQDTSIAANTSVYMFDWRALHHWGLKESNLPPGSIVLNRQPTFWEQNKRYIGDGISVILAEALLIIGLLWQRIKRKAAETKLISANKQLAADITDRKRAEATLRESEERFRLVANAAPVMIWMSGVDKLCTYFNQGWLEFTGRSLSEELGNGWAKGVYAEDLATCLGTYEHAFDRRETFQMQYRLRRHDGEYRWVFDQGVPRFDVDGSFAGYAGSFIDITERKWAEEALAVMNRKLLEAQEQERARIARELHDDINQRLALLSVEIDRMKEVAPVTYGELRSRMDELRKRTSEISAVVQSLSHELHSSKLEYLGLVSAMKGFCKEFGGKHKVEIDFSSEGIQSDVPPEISLCLFRVMQEGLRNALKHSGVKFFEVKLDGLPTEIYLTVRDSGKGFEPELAKDTPGLGLVSMQERVRLVKGTILITSKPLSGTQINVRVPLKAGAQMEKAKLAGA